MEAAKKTKAQLLSEIKGLRQRVAQLEALETEREKVETAEAESKLRLRAAIENLPFEFFVIDQSGRYVMQNSVCREHWGDIIGKRPKDLELDENNLVLWLDNNRRAFAGEVVKSEVKLKHQNEERFYHSIVAPVAKGVNIQEILGANIDITERKRAEESLRRRDYILRTLAAATKRFLEISSFEKGIQEMLEHLGQATGVSRVYVFENHVGVDGNLLTNQRYEWVGQMLPRR